MRERNEALDCYVHARAAASGGTDRFEERHWRELSDNGVGKSVNPNNLINRSTRPPNAVACCFWQPQHRSARDSVPLAVLTSKGENMSLATRIESLGHPRRAGVQRRPRQGGQPGQPDHHRQVESGRGHQRTEGRRGVVGGDRRCARRGHDHVLSNKIVTLFDALKTEILAVPMPPTTRWWKLLTAAERHQWPDALLAAVNNRALRCGAVADRG